MSIKILTKGLKFLELPAFTITDIPQLGNSFCIRKYFYTIDKRITFPRILNKPTGVYFTPVIWWLDDGEVRRKKLWKSSELVLYTPNYSSHVIEHSFAIEIWPDIGVGTLTFAGMNLETSYMIIPTIGCPVDLNTSTDYTYALGTDPVMDVGNNIWNAVEGDYWTVGAYGATTFNEGT